MKILPAQSLLLRKINIQYSLCLPVFKINRRQRDFSEIRLLVIQNAFKRPAEENLWVTIGYRGGDLYTFGVASATPMRASATPNFGEDHV